jgi:tetratricopeptide (TPR) repeat protein
MNTEHHSRKELTADRTVQWILLAVIFLAPLFFLPSSLISFQFAKVLLLYIGIIAAFCACIIARLKDGTLRLTRDRIFIALAAIPVVYAISAFLSDARSVSILGQGFEIGTLTFIVASCLFTFFVAYFFSTKRDALNAYLAFLVPVPLIALFQFIRLVAPGWLMFGVFTAPTTTLLGGWNDLGIYFGLVALFSFITLELLALERWLKAAFIAILVVSLFFLSIINFAVVWYILAGFALIFFVYNFSFNKSRAYEQSPVLTADSRRTVPVVSLVVLIVSILFILLKGNLYTSLNDLFSFPLASRFVVTNIEVRPSWGTTFQVAKSSLRENPIFGVGPNRFSNEWLKAKPDAINNTIFWGTDFNYGIGLIPTFIITTGLLGTLAWLVFFGLFLYMGYRLMFTKATDSFSGFVAISSFIIALYLWLFAFIYVPSAPLIILTFFFTGMVLASAIEHKLIKTWSVSFVKDPRTSFASVLVFIVLLLVMLGSSYTIARRFISSIYFNKALVDANVRGDVEGAQNNLVNAIRLSEQDQYYRTLSELSLIKINALLSQTNTAQEVLRNQFQDYLATARSSAQKAVSLDQTNYLNWLALGKTFEAVVPLDPDAAYTQAVAAYAEAARLNPKSPAIPLVVARLDVAKNDNVKAKQEIAKALTMKNDYTDAIFFLSQIQINEGDLKSAIKSVEAAAYLNPTNPGVFFQLGLLRYEDKDYSNAAVAFEQAIKLAPEYSNAKYFLGLSLSRLGKNADAIKQFQEVAAANPDNREVAIILANLRAGRSAFANVAPPLDDKPEKRATAPVKETSKIPSTEGR